MYVIKLTLNNLFDIYKIKEFIIVYHINVKKKRIKFEYDNLLDLFNKMIQYDIVYNKISIIQKGD